AGFTEWTKSSLVEEMFIWASYGQIGIAKIGTNHEETKSANSDLGPIYSGFLRVLRSFGVYASVAMSCGPIRILAGMSPTRERLIFGPTSQSAPDRRQQGRQILPVEAIRRQNRMRRRLGCRRQPVLQERG